MNLLSTIFSMAARLVLGIASVLLFFVLLLVGLSVFAAVLLWSLLRGRKPTLHTAAFRRASQMRAQAFGARNGGAAGPAGATGPFGMRRPQGEVVDVEVRDVTPAQPRLDLDR